MVTKNKCKLHTLKCIEEMKEYMERASYHLFTVENIQMRCTCNPKV